MRLQVSQACQGADLKGAIAERDPIEPLDLPQTHQPGRLLDATAHYRNEIRSSRDQPAVGRRAEQVNGLGQIGRMNEFERVHLLAPVSAGARRGSAPV